MFLSAPNLATGSATGLSTTHNAYKTSKYASNFKFPIITLSCNKDKGQGG